MAINIAKVFFRQMGQPFNAAHSLGYAMWNEQQLHEAQRKALQEQIDTEDQMLVDSDGVKNHQMRDV